MGMMGAADADRKINAVFAACRAALAAVASLRTPQERIDAAGQLSERLKGFSDEAAQVRNDDAVRLFDAEGLSLGQLAARMHVSKSRAAQIVDRHRREQHQPASPMEVSVPDQVMTESAADPHAPLRPAIVAAIITSKEGVLVERRHDGRPLWTFPAGEAEPGESPADTAIRETKEETGLLIKVSHTIGERTHPKTQRHMIYLACRPYQGTEVHNGDEAELAEVRWVPLAEAVDLLTGMFGPVHEHLERVLGGRG